MEQAVCFRLVIIEEEHQEKEFVTQEEKYSLYFLDSISSASVIIFSHRLKCVIHTSDWARGVCRGQVTRPAWAGDFMQGNLCFVSFRMSFFRGARRCSGTLDVACRET